MAVTPVMAVVRMVMMLAVRMMAVGLGVWMEGAGRKGRRSVLYVLLIWWLG
jgi:hypothetical protein